MNRMREITRERIYYTSVISQSALFSQHSVSLKQMIDLHKKNIEAALINAGADPRTIIYTMLKNPNGDLELTGEAFNLSRDRNENGIERAKRYLRSKK